MSSVADGLKTSAAEQVRVPGPQVCELAFTGRGGAPGRPAPWLWPAATWPSAAAAHQAAHQAGAQARPPASVALSPCPLPPRRRRRRRWTCTRLRPARRRGGSPPTASTMRLTRLWHRPRTRSTKSTASSQVGKLARQRTTRWALTMSIDSLAVSEAPAWVQAASMRATHL